MALPATSCSPGVGGWLRAHSPQPRRRGGRASVRLPRLGSTVARASAPAGQEDDGKRTAARGCHPGRRLKKTAVALDLVARGWTVSAAADAVGVTRPHLSAMQRPGERRRRGRLPLPEAEPLAEIRRLIADLRTYGYRCVHALRGREARKRARSAQSKAYLPHHEAAWPAAPTSFWSRRRTAA